MFRRRVGGVYFALITQALALAFSTLLISQQAYTGGFNGLTDYSTLFGYDITTEGAARVIYWVTFRHRRRRLFLPEMAAGVALGHDAARHPRWREPGAVPGA